MPVRIFRIYELKCQNKFYVYTNKVLFKEDYKRNSCLNQTGKKRLAKYVAEYVTRKRSDDRPCEVTAQVTTTIKEYFVPSESGTTCSPVSYPINGNNNGIRENSKNKRQTKKSN